MMQQTNSIDLKQKQKLPQKMTLITFDEDQIQLSSPSSPQSDLIQDFQNDIPKGGMSKFSQGQKSKIQRRTKVKQYLQQRKSLGLNLQNKIINYRDDDEIQGQLIDQLVDIQDIQRQNNETELFIIAFSKNSENAVNDYIKKGIIKDDDPQSIAAYLIRVEGIDKTLLGQYFGKNNQKALKILHSFCNLLKFQHVQFDKAIRQLLARFRLPGQSQQIQRIIWQFSLAYYQANNQYYQNADQLFPLAYAIIMLATDAHNPKQQKKMSRQQFIKNTQCACPSISAPYLSGIYDRITKQKFQTQINYIQAIYARLKGISIFDIKDILSLTKGLMKGDVFLKSCFNTKKFVQRKVYLSEDQKRICWVNDPDPKIGQVPRFIQIKDIIDLTVGLGSQVMKRNNVPHQFDSVCFTITTNNRSLDLKAKTIKQRSKWINYISAILIKRRQQKIQQLKSESKIRMTSQQVQQIWNTEIFPHWDDHWDYNKKKPKQKSVIVRGFQALCGCFSKEKSMKDHQFQNSSNNFKGLKIKSSVLDTLWRLGLPHNSRKILWPLVIGNNLAIVPTIIQQIKKRVRKDEDLRKFISFNTQVIQLAQMCRQYRPDIPPVRDLLLISDIFSKVFPKTQSTNPLNPLLNQIHLDHFLAFYRADKNQVDSRIKLFDYLLQVNAAGVRDHFKGLKLQIRMYLVSWFLSIFYDCFSENQQFLFRLWDNFLLEGQIYLFKVGIAIIKYYEIQLKMCTFHEGLKLLRFPKNTSPLLFFKIIEQNVNVKQEYYSQFVQKRKNAVIKTKVQSIPLQ